LIDCVERRKVSHAPGRFLSYCWQNNTLTEQVDELKQALGSVPHLEHKLAALVTMPRGVKTEV